MKNENTRRKEHQKTLPGPSCRGALSESLWVVWGSSARTPRGSEGPGIVLRSAWYRSTGSNRSPLSDSVLLGVLHHVDLDEIQFLQIHPEANSAFSCFYGRCTKVTFMPCPIRSDYCGFGPAACEVVWFRFGSGSVPSCSAETLCCNPEDGLNHYCFVRWWVSSG